MNILSLFFKSIRLCEFFGLDMYNTLKKIGCTLVTVLVCLFLLDAKKVEAQDDTENSLKSQYIFNISKFARWPDLEYQHPDKIHFCLLGNDDILSSLEQLQGKKVNQRTIFLTQFRNHNLIKDCDVLFISSSEKNIAKQAIKRLFTQPTLTVSDLDDFLSLGGMVKLYRVGQRLRFDVNLEAVESAGITISSKLLRLAGNGIEGR